MQLAVIDDHPLILDAMSSVVRDHTVEGFNDLAEFDEAIAAGRMFELVLLDLTLPNHTGLSALEYFREWYDDIPVVVLSAAHDPDTIRRALSTGAMGFIPKTSRKDVLRSAIELVASGGVYVPPEAVLAGAAGPGAPHQSAAGNSPASVEESDEVIAQRIEGLTPRQRDVLSQLLKGMPNKLICRHLGLSPNTVKTHLSAILRALNVDNRTQAVIAARGRKNVVDLSRPVRRPAAEGGVPQGRSA